MGFGVDEVDGCLGRFGAGGAEAEFEERFARRGGDGVEGGFGLEVSVGEEWVGRAREATYHGGRC